MKRVPTGKSLFVAMALLVPAGGAFAGRPVFHHHHADRDGEEQDHYSDSGAKPVKTKAGDLTLRSRALLAKDGKTQLEISTAAFDTGAAAPGNISHVHVRAVDPSGRDMDDDKDGKQLRFRQQYEHLKDGGYFTRTYPGLPHGLNLRVEAKANGALHRDEVEAKWLDVIRYRPDVMVKKVDAPAQAMVGTSVDVFATVAEQMGETGAHADCALYVNGVQVDFVPDVWVAANKVVSCWLKTTFTTAGTYNIEVRAQNVRPGDYDDSNNRLAQQITITNPVFAQYNANVSEETDTFSRTVSTYLSASSSTPDSSQTTSTVTFSQSRVFEGCLASAVNTKLNRIFYSDMSGGKSLNTVELLGADLAPTAVGDPSLWTNEDVFDDADATTGRALEVRRYFDSRTNTGATSFTVTWTAGEATFHSVNTCSGTGMACTAGDFTLNSSSGAKATLADDYSATAILDDGTPYTGKPTLALTGFGSPAPSSTSVCGPFNGGRGKRCTSTSAARFGKGGVVSMQNAQ